MFSGPLTLHVGAGASYPHKQFQGILVHVHTRGLGHVYIGARCSMRVAPGADGLRLSRAPGPADSDDYNTCCIGFQYWNTMKTQRKVI